MADNRASKSHAGSGDGTKDPKKISNYDVKAGGKTTGLIVRWNGNGYDRETCWFQADSDDVIDLDSNL